MRRTELFPLAENSFAPQWCAGILAGSHAQSNRTQQDEEGCREAFQSDRFRKVLRAHASRRHLLSSKSAKRKRNLAKAAVVDKTDEAPHQAEPALRVKPETPRSAPAISGDTEQTRPESK